MSELRIKEGKWYRRRDGVVVGPARRSGLADYPWRVGVDAYTDSGRWYCLDQADAFDLIEEVPALSAKPAVDLEIAETTFGPIEDYAQADATPRRATDIAGRAATLVGGDRDRQHGAKHDNFSRIASVWNAWLAIRKDPAEPLTAHDVGCMMAMMKLARTQSGALNVDDYVDACGYAACAGEVAQQDTARST